MSFQTFVTQQLALLTATLNSIATNAKRIFELPEQTLLIGTSWLHVDNAGVSQKLQLQKIISAISQTYIDRLIYVDEITIVDNDVTVPAGVQALISNITYFTTTDFTEEIPFADTGKSRIDIIVIDNTSTLSVITGIETLGVAVRPNIPLNSVLVTQINVTDSAFTTVDGLLYKGEFDSLEELNTLHPSALSGSYAIVSTLSSSTVYYWSVTNGVWFTNAGGGGGGVETVTGPTVTGTSTDRVVGVPTLQQILALAGDRGLYAGSFVGLTNLDIDYTYKSGLVVFDNSYMDSDMTLTVKLGSAPDYADGMEYVLTNISDYVLTFVADTGVTLDAQTLIIPKYATAHVRFIQDSFNSVNVGHFAITYEFGVNAAYTDATFGAFANGLTGKSTPIDADLLNITDTADSNKQKKLSFTNLKAFLKTYFDTLYTNASAVATQITTALSGYATQSYADGKVQNDLTPSTTVAPSATAVNLGLSEIFTKSILYENHFWVVPSNTQTPSNFGYSQNLGGTFTMSGNVAGTRGMILYATTTTPGNIAFKRRHDQLQLQGLTAKITEKISFQTNVSGQRFFHGLTKANQFSAPTNVDQTTLTDIVGVCQLSSSTNMHIIHNDSSGTATTIDLGASYPCNDSSYDYFIEIQQNPTNYIVIVTRRTIATGATINTTPITLSSNIMAYNTGVIQLLTWITNNATSAVASYLDGGIAGNFNN